MEVLRYLQELKVADEQEVQQLARTYGIELTFEDIQALRPLLDHVSIHWLWAGIPADFIEQVQQAIGEQKSAILLSKYQQLRL